jgi:hypothetical protein
VPSRDEPEVVTAGDPFLATTPPMFDPLWSRQTTTFVCDGRRQKIQALRAGLSGKKYCPGSTT